MRRGSAALVFLTAIIAMTFALTGCEKQVNTELIQAQEAIDAAKAEGAPDFCPEQFADAELKLRQAQLLFEDRDKTAGIQAANEASELGKQALDCTLIAKQPEAVFITVKGFPDELANMTATVHFDFNKNAISSEYAAELKKFAQTVKKYQKALSFWVVVETYSDLKGATQDNLTLSKIRANVIRYFLKTEGVDVDRIYLVPKGEELAKENASVNSENKKLRKANKDFRKAEIYISKEYPGK